MRSPRGVYAERSECARDDCCDVHRIDSARNDTGFTGLFAKRNARFSASMLVLVTALLPWSFPRGQACCTLQGFHSQGSAGSFADFDGLDFTDARNRTQFQIQVGGSDDWDSWVTDNTIVNGPLLGYSAGVNRWLTRGVLMTSSLAGSLFSISELLSQGGSKSGVRIASLRFRGSWVRSGGSRIVWFQLTHPLYENYTNNEFPFRVSPARTMELGYVSNQTYFSRGGKPRLFSAKVNLRKDARNDNLYQFNYYLTGQIAWSYRIYSAVSPFLSVYLKQGSLRPVESAIYTTRFPRTLFAYGLVGAGLQLQPPGLRGIVIRSYFFYPVIRWSDRYLPAGFEEKPVAGVTVTRALNLGRKGV